MAKQNIKIIDFLKKAQIGDIHLGQTIKEVIGILGPPTEQYDLRNGFLLAYGGWEILFTDKKPYQSFLIHHDELLYDCTNHDEVIAFQSDLVNLDLGIIKPFTQVRLKDVKAWLDKENVHYHVKLKEGQPLMKLNSGVYLDFLDKEPVVPQPNVHSCPAKNIELQQNDKIQDLEDYVLYTIGIFNHPTL